MLLTALKMGGGGCLSGICNIPALYSLIWMNLEEDREGESRGSSYLGHPVEE